MKFFFELLLIGALFGISFQQNFTTEDRADECDCGVAPRVRRIVGGVEASLNEFPWLVSLLANTANGYVPFCGATLLSHNWLVSAAHCFESGIAASSVKASLGEHDLSTTSETPNVVRSITTIVSHPQYNTKTHDYDIAMLKMSARVEFTETIRPICLPPTDFISQDKTATVAGWGATSEGGSAAKILREVDLPVISTTKCQNAYGSNYPISSNMICAGYAQGQKDACQGDSGGPLFCKCPNGRRTQIGIVSFGIGCGRPGLPGVYSDFVKLQTFAISYATGDGLCRTPCS